MKELADIANSVVAKDWTKEETISSSILGTDAGYSEIKMIIPIGLNREFVLGRTWEEATGNFDRRE